MKIIRLADRLSAERLVRAAFLSVAWDGLFARPDRRDRFIAYLVEVYHHVKYSVPLMQRAVALLDGRCEPIRIYLERHIAEETGHERWMLDDLVRLGFDPERVVASRSMRETAAFVGTQFYVMEEFDPVAFLGYIYALESSASSPAHVEELSRDLDIPIDALFTLTEHAAIDWGEHVAALESLFSSEVLTPEQEELVVWNYGVTMEQLTELVLAVADRSDVDAGLQALRCSTE